MVESTGLLQDALLITILLVLAYHSMEIKHMSDATKQIADDVAQIKTLTASMADAYTNAAAAKLQAALDAQKAAIEAEDESDLAQAHQDAQDVITALKANQPITPPATPDNPNPTPVVSPADPTAVDATTSGGAAVAGDPANQGQGDTTAEPAKAAPDGGAPQV